ncbi:MAG TPA: hypothetical protein VNC50_20755, partial [Planctomycetia bacterium]|nr:hypothetical protein [Planctomycetia bacterium]
MARPASLLAATCLLAAAAAFATDRVILKDGLALDGELDLKEHRVFVKQRQRIYYVSRGGMLKPEQGVETPPLVSFEVPQPVRQKEPKPITPLSGIVRSSEFDEFGRRSVTLADSRKRTATMTQLIYRLLPSHVETDLAEASFRSTAPLGQLSDETLRKLLRRSIDPKSALDRAKTVEFLLDAERFGAADREVAAFKQDFTADSAKSKELADKLQRRLGDFLFARLSRWLAVGQPGRALALEAEMRKIGVPADLAPKLEQVRTELAAGGERIRKAKIILRDALDRITPRPESHRDLAAAVQFIEASLGPATYPRLAPMVAHAEQRDRKPEEIVALGVSGWRLGADLARKDLELAADYWRRGEAIRQALEADETPFQELLQRLVRPGAAGQNPPGADLFARMIPLLPAAPCKLPADAESLVAGAGRHAEEFNYRLYLPPEYDVHRAYPLVITLHDLGATAEKQMQLWRGLAADYGWIVAAPEWRTDPAASYAHALEEHGLMHDILCDIRKRFAVDGDRVFLTGHGMGAVAAWDYGMAHPDEFAGLVPVGGAPVKFSERYAGNLGLLPSFAIVGGIHAAANAPLQAEFNKFCEKKLDAVLVEYPARGMEGFGAELSVAAEWMYRKRRNAYPAEFSALSCRECDRRFYWARIDEFRSGATVPPELYKRQKVQPATVSGTITDANAVLVKT